ncbi:unnamed protein product, partial [Amoebophrya sp. A25]
VGLAGGHQPHAGSAQNSRSAKRSAVTADSATLVPDKNCLSSNLVRKDNKIKTSKSTNKSNNRTRKVRRDTPHRDRSPRRRVHFADEDQDADAICSSAQCSASNISMGLQITPSVRAAGVDMQEESESEIPRLPCTPDEIHQTTLGGSSAHHQHSVSAG